GPPRGRPTVEFANRLDESDVQELHHEPRRVSLGPAPIAAPGPSLDTKRGVPVIVERAPPPERAAPPPARRRAEVAGQDPGQIDAALEGGPIDAIPLRADHRCHGFQPSVPGMYGTYATSMVGPGGCRDASGLSVQ